MITFKHLYDYIQNAPVDYTGVHEIDDLWSLHIYSNKRQVNIQKEGLSLLNIVFDDNQVMVVGCTAPGYANYSDFIRLPITAPITIGSIGSTTWRYGLKSDPDTYRTYLDRFPLGKEAHETIRDLLYPIYRV